MLNMNEAKTAIVNEFKLKYGFAPAKKNIIPMESSGEGNKIDWMAFCVNNVGYEFSIYRGLSKSEIYNI